MSTEIPLPYRLTVEQAIAAANAAKIGAQQALASIPAVIDAEVGPASAPYIAQSEDARDAALVAQGAAEAARDNALATERRMRQQSLGTFANDAAAVAWAAGQSPAITIITGSSYLNTTSDIFRYAVVSAGPTIVWHDVTEDEAAQVALATSSATAAAASADVAFNSKNLAVTAKEDAQSAAASAGSSSVLAAGYSGTAVGARDAAIAARDVATGARDTALGYSSAATSAYSNTAALQAGVSASAIIAQQAANNALLPSLSVLAAAQRAIKISTALVAGAAVPYDTTKDEVSDWPRKCVSQSYLSDTLNTATRGTVAAVPAQMIVSGETTVLSVFMGTDGLGALWKSWTVAGLTCVFARNGSIYYGASNGLFVLDLISDKVFLYQTGGLYVCVNQNVATYNQGTATWSLIGSSAQLPSNVVNSIAATIAPNTPLNPARCNLPNPTVAVGTSGGVSVIRWDGVVVNSASTTAVISTCFDLPSQPGAAPNLWTLTAAGLNVTNQYQAASWAVAGLASFTAAQLGIGTLAKVTACGPGMVAIAGSNGLATLKLDPTNPANSLYRVKTSTYDSGWMVLGKTVLALAESSTDLSAISDAELLVGGASPDTSSGWTAAAGGATLVAGAGTSGTAGWIAYQAITTVVGKRYRVKATLTNGTAAAFFCASSSLNAADLASIGGVAGARELTFVAETTTTFIQLAMNESSAGQTCSFANLSTKATPNEVSGSGVSPAAVGSPTRAQVASGADCAGYGGFSTLNYFQTAPGAWAPGSADFAIVGWANFTGSGKPLFGYQDGVGTAYGANAHFVVETEGSNLLVRAFDGTNAASSTAATYLANTTAMYAVIRRGQTFEVYVNGAKIATFSAGSLGSITNAAASVLYGMLYYNAAPAESLSAGSSLALPRVFSCAPTPDQIAFMYADEKGRFVANAKELLSGANVQAVAFDPDTNQLAASNSTGGTDVFSGPGFSVRVANQKSTTAINRVRNSAMSGITAGAVAGSYVDSGSTMNLVAGGGLSKSIVSVGPGYFDLRINGTANAASYFSLMLGKYQDAVAVSGQPWTGACQLALIAGSWANVTSPMLVLSEFNSGASTLASSNAALSGLTSSLANKIVSRTFNQATAAYANLDIDGTFANGAVIDFTLRIYQPFLAQVASFTSFSDGLSANDNHKAAAFMGGDLVVATGGGVDAFLAVKPGLRETAGAAGSPRRPFYDPTWGQFYGLTTDATPTVFASIPIPEGKAYRFRASVVAVMYGGTATEKAVYDITGVVSRDIGGNVVVVSTTTTVSEVTSTMDCVAQANTTAQTLEIKATGKASTRIAWFDGQELYDVGLMAAA